MVDPGINPPDRIDGICTIRRDPGTNEEILCHVSSHPFPNRLLFFNRPPAMCRLPNLIRGFIQSLLKQGVEMRIIRRKARKA